MTVCFCADIKYLNFLVEEKAPDHDIWKVFSTLSNRSGPDPRLGGKFQPRYLPVEFTGPENTPKVANTGKYWSIEFFALKYHRNVN